jgi:hypothetical protein
MGRTDVFAMLITMPANTYHKKGGGDTLSRVAGWSCWIAACDLEGSPLKTIMSGRVCFYCAQTT